MYQFSPLMAGFLRLLQMNNFGTEHDTTKLITPFHSESTALSGDIDISYCSNLSKIGKISLFIDLMFCQNFAIFTMCSKHQIIHISRFAILS